jgi:hypothetical protein
MSPNLAHLGDGSRPSWRPLIGVVLPALSRLGHKGRPVPRMAVGGNYPNRILAQSPARATRSGHDHGFVQAGGRQTSLLAYSLWTQPAPAGYPACQKCQLLTELFPAYRTGGEVWTWPGFCHPCDLRANHYPWPRFCLPRRIGAARLPVRRGAAGQCGISATGGSARHRWRGAKLAESRRVTPYVYDGCGIKDATQLVSRDHRGLEQNRAHLPAPAACNRRRADT